MLDDDNFLSGAGIAFALSMEGAMKTSLDANKGTGTGAQCQQVRPVKPAVRTICRSLGVRRLTWLLAAVFFVGGCSSGQDIAAAEGQISRFRQLMATQEFGRIYAEAADELRKTATEQDMVALLAAVDRKLGAVKDAEKNGWNVNFQTSGTFVTLGFKTQFEHGRGVETFVYRIADGRALLAGYHINSNALITN
jgi:hypothetical protein